MKLVVLLRVKNGKSYLNDWLSNISKIADEIVVVDNGSTDGTFEILKIHPKVVDIVQTSGFDEGRDKIMVYEMARKRNPDWCLWLDIDEIFESNFSRVSVDKMMSSRIFTKFAFRRFHLHKDEMHYQGGFKQLLISSFHDRILWKEQSTGYFKNLKIHNGNIKGIKGPLWLSHYRIKHYGYLYNIEIENKTKVYLEVDAQYANKEMYIKHSTQKVKVLKWFENKCLQKSLQQLYLDLILFLVVLPKNAFKKLLKLFL